MIGAVVIRVMDMTQAYVVDCDLDADDGRGHFTFTRYKSQAKRFADVAEALAYYRRVSPRRPTRPDGLPNRPLTAFSVVFDPVEPAP